jgi:hypothetical protein
MFSKALLEHRSDDDVSSVEVIQCEVRWELHNMYEYAFRVYLTVPSALLITEMNGRVIRE